MKFVVLKWHTSWSGLGMQMDTWIIFYPAYKSIHDWLPLSAKREAFSLKQNQNEEELSQFLCVFIYMCVYIFMYIYKQHRMNQNSN